jgi:hypothetical protein
MKAALATEDQSRPSLDVGVRAFRDVFALAQLADANTLALAVASACIQLVHEPANTMRDCCRQYSF